MRLNKEPASELFKLFPERDRKLDRAVIMTKVPNSGFRAEALLLPRRESIFLSIYLYLSIYLSIYMHIHLSAY